MKPNERAPKFKCLISLAEWFSPAYFPIRVFNLPFFPSKNFTRDHFFFCFSRVRKISTYFFLLHIIFPNWRRTLCHCDWNGWEWNWRHKFHRIQISIFWQILFCLYFSHFWGFRAVLCNASNNQKIRTFFYESSLYDAQCSAHRNGMMQCGVMYGSVWMFFIHVKINFETMSYVVEFSSILLCSIRCKLLKGAIYVLLSRFYTIFTELLCYWFRSIHIVFFCFCQFLSHKTWAIE